MTMLDAKTQHIGGRKGASGAKAMLYDVGNAEMSLRERVKELTCLYRLGEVIERCEGSLDPLDVLFQGIADILPESWLHSEIAQARIVFGGREYATADFQESLWAMSADLVVAGKNAGAVEIHYLDEMPTVDEGPFLNEERSLINAVAERLGKVVERLEARKALRERVKELTCLYKLGEVIDRCDGSCDPFDILFQGAADILPESWLYPEIAQARIVFDGREYATTGFQESSWTMAADLVVSGRKIGVVEVHYSQETPIVYEGPFQNEERSLINAVAERLGRAVEHIQAEHIVRIEQSALRHKNIAMGEILNKIQQEKKQIGRQVMANVDKIIMPVLDDLEQGLSERQRRVAAILRDSLHEITSPFVDRISNCFEVLTPTQVRVCNFVRRGMTSKEIAAIEHISPGTVRVQRFNIRRKLGLLNKNVNLQTFLQSAMPNVASE